MSRTGIYSSVIGLLAISYEDEYIVGINILDEENTEIIDEKSFISDNCFLQIKEYLDGKRKTFDLKYKLCGTEFQKTVWDELLKIPYGKTRSYKDVAIAIGRSSSARAVGNANNHNPIMIIVPCHRVIGNSGKLVGYAGGLKVKEKLLSIEKSNL
ncbi:MAG: methylated-DNA--[protein]-cysteine S-methyltransferase [Anaerovoracaceae bacterium]